MKIVVAKLNTTIILLLCLLFSGQAVAYNVIAFGDSVTAGYYRTASGRVVTLGCRNGQRCGGAIPYLDAYLDSQVEPSAVYNWGWPGERSGYPGNGSPGGIYRLPGVLNTAPSGSIVLLMEGLNDIIANLSLGDAVKSMEIMIDQTRSKNMTPILGLTTPNSINSSWYNTGRSVLNPALARMADRKNVLWVDHWHNMAVKTSWNNNHSGDRLHLSAAGNRVLAAGWLEAIKQQELKVKADALEQKITSIDDLGSKEISDLKVAALACLYLEGNTEANMQSCVDKKIAAIEVIALEVANSILDMIPALIR